MIGKNPARARGRRLFRTCALVLSLAVFQTALPGCFGRFALTRKIYAINQSISDKWLRSIVTFVMVAIPVYGFCAFIDWAFFNTVEFWNGTNPIDGQNADPPRESLAPQVKIIASEGSAIQLFLSPDGSELRVESQRPGEDKKILVLSIGERNAVLRDGSGQLIAMLSSGDDGSAQIRGAGGEILEEKSALETARLAESLRAGGRQFLAELLQQSGRKLAAR